MCNCFYGQNEKNIYQHTKGAITVPPSHFRFRHCSHKIPPRYAASVSAVSRTLDECPCHKFSEIIAERCVGRRHCRRPRRARREPVPVPFIKSMRFSAVFDIRPRLTALVTRARRRRAILISDSDNERCPAHPRRRFNLWMPRPPPLL